MDAFTFFSDRLTRSRPEIKWLVGQLKPRLRGFTNLISVVSLGGLLTAVDPLLVRWMLDNLRRSRGPLFFVCSGVLLMGCYLGRISCENSTTVLTVRLTQLFIVTLRLSIVKCLLGLSARYHDRTAVGRTVFQLNDDSRLVAETTVSVFGELTRVVVGTGAMLVTMFYVNAPLTLLIVPLIVVHAIVKRQRGREIIRSNEEVWTCSESVSTLSQQISFGAIHIQILRCEATLLKHFVRMGRKLRDAVVSRQNMDSRLTLLARTPVVFGMALVLAYGGYMVTMNRLTVGALVALYTCVMRVCEPLAVVIDLDSRAERGMMSLRQIYAIVEEANREKHAGPFLHNNGRVPSIRFSRVSYSYPGRDTILRSLDFTIAPGQRVVLAGPSGSGKTTILKLLLGLYEGYDGCIYFDGRDISAMSRKWRRAHFSVVPQDVFLFNGTLRDNLLLANRHATPWELDMAIETGQLRDLIHRLPHGLEQSVGPQGTLLSGGEKQRLAIARALLQPSPMFLLDEFTSSLDWNAEEALLNALDGHFKGRTVIATSHRPAVVAWADRVLGVQSNGEVVEIGAGQLEVL